MRLSVKNNDGVVNDLTFEVGPVYIGRRMGLSVFLPDTAVSREHAMLYIEQDDWFVEDLQSANKTYLNENAIHKAQLKNADILQIGSFTLIVSIDQAPQQEAEQISQSDDTLELEAMLSTPRDEVVVRNIDGSHAPAMRLAAKRLTEFSIASETICDSDNLEDTINTVVKIIMEQFDASCVWCGIRKQTNEQISLQVGKRKNGDTVELDNIKLKERIEMALKKGRSSVLPQVAPSLEETDRIRSALITVIQNSSGSYGVLYVHNSMKQKHYSLSDLDYLMLIAMHTAAVIKKYL
ncbi:MAG: FHA domain-containing protein [Anaerohalosphaera sp.]|nr:FHA domain-containing protein [Anaerohalosphaera sp.]